MKRSAPVLILWLALININAAQASYPLPAAGSHPHYDISIRVLPDEHRLEARGTMRIPASDTARETLRIALSKSMSDFTVQVTEPSASAGPAQLEREKEYDFVWAVRPPKPIAPGESVLLSFSYRGGEQLESVFYIGPEGSFANGLRTLWYPQILLPKVNNPKSTGRLRFSVPAGYTVIAAGKLRSTPEHAARGDFSYEIPWPTYFAFGVGKYSIFRKSDTTPISLYLLRPRENVNEYLEGVSRVLGSLVRELGAYPFGQFVLVEVPNEQADKSGFAGNGFMSGIFVTSRFLDSGFNRAFYGHEIGHQWFGNLVTAGDAIFDEGMANYASLRVVEDLEGAAAAEQYRRTGYPGYNPVQNGLGYLMLNAGGFDQKLSELSNGPAHMGYIKGFLVMDLLSREIGLSQFRSILQNYLRQHAFQIARWDEFWRAIQKGANRDLRWFYEQWFERTGAPDWQLTWGQQGQTLRGVITQSPPYYRAKVEVVAEGDGCQRLVRIVEIRGARTEFSWPVRFQVKSVVLDPRFLLLRWTPEYRVLAPALAPYAKWYVLDQYPQVYQELESSLKHTPTPDVYGARFMIEYSLARVFIYEKKWDEAKSHLEAALASPSRRADVLPWVYLRLAVVAKQLHDDATLRWAVNAAITADAQVGGQTGAADQARALLRDN